MNVLHVLSQNHLTGAEVYATDLIKLQVQNHKVFQVSNGFFKATAAEKIILPVETKSVFQFLKSARALRKILIKNNIQVIHAHSRAASKLVNVARFGLKIGYVSTVHGRQHLSMSKKINNVYGDFVISVCENIELQLKNEFKYNPRRTKTIENGIDTQLFHFQSQKPHDPILKIGIIGRDTGPKKIRTEIFINEFSKILNAQNIKYKFYVVGGKNYNILDNNLEINNAESKIDSDFYHQYDLICGSGRVCIEALLAGVPVIAFGESQYCGLVTHKNYYEFKKSNFGDIGFNFTEPVFNPEKAISDLKNLPEVSLKILSDIANQDFNLKVVNKKIERMYESSYFLRNYSKWIPILMYHKIPDTAINSPHKIFVTKNNFEKHLHFFKNRSFTTLTFTDLAKFKSGEKCFSEFPKKPLILTFDDGYLDNIENADPLLKKYNFTSQIYLLADATMTSNTWDQWAEGMSSEKHLIASDINRSKWLKTNFEIGSHGLNHKKMPLMTASEKMYELAESKKRLENEFNIKINSFAYTYGDTNSDCAEACQLAGYDYGLNTDNGSLLLEENPYSIFRVNIFPNETLFSLWKKTSYWYRKYYFFKRGK